ncbi:MAG: diguanylate cyclase [Acidobacteriota bacterium]|nr:diguanylate cyclase [Acidobacteriota bacterium]
MKLFGRQDLLLIGALTTALIVIFSSPISRMLDYAREIEKQSGLTLIPALALLMVAFLFHQYRRNAQEHAKAAAAEAATRAAQHRAAELERLVSFGQSLGRSLDFDSIRIAIGSHLHELAGTDKLWVLVREGNEWQALSGDTRGAEEVLQWDDLAEQLLAGADKTPTELSAPRTIGIPLIVGGTAMGVLGVKTEAGQLPADKRRILEAAAALLAVSVKNAQLFREVKENSVRDALTGCFTRGHSLDVIDAELRRARRSQTPVTLIMFDLDHFKDVNDRHGHLCGDAVLSAVGKRMKDVLRGSDLKCRYGGEEFLVLLPETPLHGARRVAETLRKEIAERPVPWAGEALTVTASFGLAQTLPGEVNVQAVIARADQALYRAKDDGRNCVRIAAETTTLVADESNRTNRVS